MGKHTIEDIEILKEWFTTHELPKSLRLDKSTYIIDVKSTVTSLLDQAFIHYANPGMQGGIVVLKKIKSMLEES